MSKGLHAGVTQFGSPQNRIRVMRVDSDAGNFWVFNAAGSRSVGAKVKTGGGSKCPSNDSVVSHNDCEVFAATLFPNQTNS